MLAVANLAPWFLVVFSKTIHCRLNLTIDLENSGKTTLESERIVFLSWFEAEIWLLEVDTSLVPDLVMKHTCVIWFLVVFSKTIHYRINLTIDLENSGKTTLEKWKNCVFIMIWSWDMAPWSWHFSGARFGDIAYMYHLMFCHFIKTIHCGLNWTKCFTVNLFFKIQTI